MAGKQPPAAQRQAAFDHYPMAMCLSKIDDEPCRFIEPMGPNTLQRAKDHARYHNHAVRVVHLKLSMYYRPDYDQEIHQDDPPEYDSHGGYSSATQHMTATGWVHDRTECKGFLCGLLPPRYGERVEEVKHASGNDQGS